MRRFLFLLLSFRLLAQTQLPDAVALTRAGHYREARALLQDVPEPLETSQRIAFHRLKAAVAAGLNEPAQAAEEMRTALRLAPSDSALCLAAAFAEEQAGQLDNALSTAERAGESAPAKALIGDIREKRGQFPEAVEAYRRAVALDPSREQYRMSFGLELVFHGAFDEAIKVLRQSVQQFPSSGSLLTLLGIAFYANGEPSESEQAFNDAILKNPGFEPAYRCLAKIILEASAVPSQRTAEALCKWNDRACSAVQLRIARERHDDILRDKAIAILSRAPGDDAMTRCALGQAYEWSGRIAEARPQMEACAKLDPTPQNLYRLGLLFQKLGEPERAKDQFEARKQMLQKMSEQTAVGLSALELLQKRSK